MTKNLSNYMSRVCPECGREIIYYHKSSLRRAHKDNSKCRLCSQKGKVVSDETKQKMKDNHYDVSGKNNPNYGKVSVLKGKKWEEFRTKEGIAVGIKRNSKGLFSGHKHTDETKNLFRIQTTQRNLTNNPAKRDDVKCKLRVNALDMIKRGAFGRKSGIEVKMENLLIDMDIKYVQEYTYGFFSFDFYLPTYNVFIECDGDYFHANPQIYYGTELSATQKNNVKRGKAKDTFMKNKNEVLLRFWECDINNNIDTVRQVITNTIQANE